MSGGHFNYLQYRFGDVATMIDELVASNDRVCLDFFGQEVGYKFPTDIIAKFKEAAKTCRLAESMAQRVDWLVSGDDGYESFRERWDEEVESLR